MTSSSESLHTVATVAGRWASPFQKQAGEKALREVLQTWREFYIEKHRDNDITIKIGSDSNR